MSIDDNDDNDDNDDDDDDDDDDDCVRGREGAGGLRPICPQSLTGSKLFTDGSQLCQDCDDCDFVCGRDARKKVIFSQN